MVGFEAALPCCTECLPEHNMRYAPDGPDCLLSNNHSYCSSPLDVTFLSRKHTVEIVCPSSNGANPFAKDKRNEGFQMYR